MADPCTVYLTRAPWCPKAKKAPFSLLTPFRWWEPAFPLWAVTSPLPVHLASSTPSHAAQPLSSLASLGLAHCPVTALSVTQIAMVL